MPGHLEIDPASEDGQSPSNKPLFNVFNALAAGPRCKILAFSGQLGQILGQIQGHLAVVYAERLSALLGFSVHCQAVCSKILPQRLHTAATGSPTWYRN